jgi:hypothetical protein
MNLPSNKIKIKNNQSGQVIISAVIFFLSISLIVLVGITSPIAFQVRNSADFIQSKQGFIGADNLNEEVLYRLNKNRDLPNNLVLSYSDAISTALISDIDGAVEVLATGVSGLFSRQSKAVFSQGQGVSLIYGLQAGTGGVEMSGGAGVIGNLYSNGPVVGTGGPYVTGSVFVADKSMPSVGASLESPVPISNQYGYSYVFGGQISSSNPNPNDYAQSFYVSTTTPVSMIKVYLKKYDDVWMNNITVRITNTATSTYQGWYQMSHPGKTSLGSAVINHSSVSTDMSPMTVVFPTPITLTPGQRYWFVLDTSNTWGSYYSVAVASGEEYDGDAVNGSWSSSGVGGTWHPAPGGATNRIVFDVYTGGEMGNLSGVLVQGGDAKAFSITNSTIAGTPYCQSGSGNNKPCNTTQSTPSQANFPISQNQIDGWKAEAQSGVTRGTWSIGGSTSTSTPGNMKIDGDLTVSSGATLNLNGTLYVTGNINMSGSGKIQISNQYGNKPLAIVVDGRTDISGGAFINGNGGNRSYALLVSTNKCPDDIGCSGDDAISASGGTGSIVLIAQDGTITFSGGTSAKSAVANKMIMLGGTTLNYDSGLANLDFSSGPSGAWTVESWKEIGQ